MDKNIIIKTKEINYKILKMLRKFLKQSQDQFDVGMNNKRKLNNYQSDCNEKDINEFKLSKIKRYHPYTSNHSEIIYYCINHFNLEINNDINLNEFKIMIIDSYKNIINYNNKGNSKNILEDFQNKIIISLQWCKEIYDIIKFKVDCNKNKTKILKIKEFLNINNDENLKNELDLPQDLINKTRCRHLSRLIVYIKIIGSLKEIIPLLTEIKNSKLIIPNGCGLSSCSISGGRNYRN